MKSLLAKTGIALGLAASMVGVGAAQQTTPAPERDGGSDGQRYERMGRRRGPHKMGGERHGGGLRLLRQLNLSDAQRQQIRGIHESYAKRTEAQREELRQLSHAKREGGELTPEQHSRARQLRTDLRATSESLHGEVLGVLTPEQRTQLEQLMKERKQRHEEFRQRRRPQQNEQQ